MSETYLFTDDWFFPKTIRIEYLFIVVDAQFSFVVTASKVGLGPRAIFTCDFTSTLSNKATLFLVHLGSGSPPPSGPMQMGPPPVY